MKKSLVLFIALHLTIACLAQDGIVKGHIVEARTFKPLPFATVYLNQTTIGTVTDTEGNFQLQHISAGVYDLVVTFIGYKPYQSKVTVNDSIPVTVSIKMVTSTTNLGEVLVKAKKDDKWKLQYDRFIKEFFGGSEYSRLCKISNPWAIEFTEDAKGNLTATSPLPIEIENLGLGYNITCQLKEFVVGPKQYKISGTYRFTKAETIDTTLGALWNSRRHEVYLGSPRHLMKAIVDHRVAEEGFDLYTDISNNPEVVRNSSFLTNVNVSLKPLPVDNLLSPGKSLGLFTVNLPRRTEVHYLNRSASAKIYRNILHPISWIETSGPVEISTDGHVLNPNRMIALGAMSEGRVAELLPLDYRPQEPTPKATQVASSERTYSKLAALLEKPYLTTDKAYYYPADVVYFKALFNYISPAYRDSLSHVIHVDIIDASKKIIQSKVFPVNSGSSYGDFILPITVAPGDYTLRAYTRWMMNFDKQLIFTKGIKILPVNQLGKVNEVAPVTKQVNILTDREDFFTREKITLAIDPTNFFGNPVAASLSVSVTDIEQAAIPLNEKNIITSFAFTKEMLPDSSLKKPNYTIQSGIDFKGQLVTGKSNKPSSGVLTVYQDNVNDVFGVPTDEVGRFHRELQLLDSVELLVAAKTLKGRKAKVLMEEIKDPAPEIDLASPLQLETYKPTDASKYHVVDLFSTAKMLEAVTIEAKRVEQARTDMKHLSSDSHIDGETLRATNAQDLLSALRGRIPGLQILYFKDPSSGDVTRFLAFGGISGFRGMQEALVELDGVVLTPFGGQSVADRLASMGVQEVESIDFVRFGSAAAYGARAANGVIVIKSRLGSKPATDNRRIDRSKLQVVNMVGYSTAKEFESPDYSELANGDDRSDFRSTIYWNPVLYTDGTDPAMVTFYAADIPTRYRIVVEGVTADGQAIRGEKIIVVRSKK